MAPAGGDIQRERNWIIDRGGIYTMCLTPPWDGSGGHKNSARLQPCGTKEKEREMRNLLPLLYHKITKGAMKWQLQKDGRYRAKITVGTDAI